MHTYFNAINEGGNTFILFVRIRTVCYHDMVCLLEFFNLLIGISSLGLNPTTIRRFVIILNYNLFFSAANIYAY